MVDLNLIKPDGSGKHSERLYKFLTSKKAREWGYDQVFKVASDLSWKPGEWHPFDIIIGRSQAGGGVSGRTLASIVRGDRGSGASVFFFGRNWHPKEITDEFWCRYVDVGCCAWDPRHTGRHVRQADDRYQVGEDENRRTCRWCGTALVARHREEVKVYKWIEWEPAPA